MRVQVKKRHPLTPDTSREALPEKLWELLGARTDHSGTKLYQSESHAQNLRRQLVRLAHIVSHGRNREAIAKILQTYAREDEQKAGIPTGTLQAVATASVSEYPEQSLHRYLATRSLHLTDHPSPWLHNPNMDTHLDPKHPAIEQVPQFTPGNLQIQAVLPSQIPPDTKIQSNLGENGAYHLTKAAPTKPVVVLKAFPDNPSRHLHPMEQEALAHFGTTTTPHHVGYILRDGRMLNFSGEHLVTSPSEKLEARQNDMRGADHADIAQIPPLSRGGHFDPISEFLHQTGAVRFDTQGDHRVVQTIHPLSLEQRTQIQKLSPQYGGILGEVSSRSSYRPHYSVSQRYQGTPNLSRILDQINHYATQNHGSWIRKGNGQDLPDIGGDPNEAHRLPGGHPHFYSGLHKLLHTRMKSPMQAPDLVKFASNNGISKDEIEGSGLHQLQGKVTPQQALDHVKANAPRLSVTSLSGGDGIAKWQSSDFAPTTIPKDHPYLSEVTPGGTWHTLMVNGSPEVHVYSHPDDDAAPRFTQKNNSAPGEFSVDRLNNRSIESGMHSLLGRYTREHLGNHDAVYSNYSMPGGTNYREDLLKLPSNPSGGDYHSDHWRGHPNVLAHIRMKDRTDADGKRALNLEEVQSDWHQTGREKGWKSESQKALRAGIALEYNLKAEGKTAEEIHAHPELTRLMNLGMRHNMPPDTSHKDDHWHQLAIRHALHEAVKGGYDRLSINPPEVQNGSWSDIPSDGQSLYYGKKHPAYLDALAKKFGTTTGKSLIAHYKPKSKTFIDPNPQAERLIPINAHHIDITPEMREHILSHGVPLWGNYEGIKKSWESEEIGWDDWLEKSRSRTPEHEIVLALRGLNLPKKDIRVYFDPDSKKVMLSPGDWVEESVVEEALSQCRAISGVDGVDAEAECTPGDEYIFVKGYVESLRRAESATNSNPSPAQVAAENFAKGSFVWKGLRITIENPKGSIRRGKDPKRPWQVTMGCAYGYFNSQPLGRDGDAVDVFVCDENLDSDVVFIVNQCKQDGSFDEHKVVIGCNNEKDARKAYLSCYSAGWKCGEIKAMMLPEFKSWLDSGHRGVAKAIPIVILKATSPEAHPELSHLVDSYRRDRGITTPHMGAIGLNTETSKRLADAYEQMPHTPNDPKTQSAYKTLSDETIAQHDHLIKHGYRFTPWRKEGQPYADSQEMLEDLHENKHLHYFPTDQGFGTNPADSGNPLEKPSGRVASNGEPMLVNDVFRAVHDVFGHGVHGYSFGPLGEERAWHKHASMFTPEALPALTTETRGQNSWVNYGKHLRSEDGEVPEKGSPGWVHPIDRPYAQQKTGLLPEWAHSEGSITPPKRGKL
jgi:hypothetical protein